MSAIADSIQLIKDSINTHAQKANRNVNDILLMAVSKFRTIAEIEEAYNCGIRLFGENRVQEAAQKFTVLNKAPFSEFNVHIIGNLQRNKVKKAVQIAQCIESVDRLELLYQIENECAKINKKISVFFEVHTGEESKAGFSEYEKLFECVEKSQQCSHIVPAGFMTMAPFTDDEKRIRNSFSTLRETAQKIRTSFPQLLLTQLSMGMSNDYGIAIEEGSTLVRIGTALFGARTTA